MSKPKTPTPVTDNGVSFKVPEDRRMSKVAFELPEGHRTKKSNVKKIVDLPKKGDYNYDTGVKELGRSDRLRIHKEFRDATERTPTEDTTVTELTWKQKKARWWQRLLDYFNKADLYVLEHPTPVHHFCIGTAAALIPFFLLTITWDVLAILVFEIPHLSTISAPTFILLINFMAIPMAMYGYMTEYLIHEYSRLAVIGLICIVIQPILFAVRAYMEYIFDGYRNESKHYFENEGPGEVYEYPIGTFGVSRDNFIRQEHQHQH